MGYLAGGGFLFSMIALMSSKSEGKIFSLASLFNAPPEGRVEKC